ncbi:uncharacterized protein LOC109815905 isoform X2 [Cajanus cajan]|uniref:uncharacterized protein LOC109815905 isoform X2 n=1 Tax=Cajanus cajan TaxID=3821 RepID=UPI00098DCD2B|nr:uncharacterized protein LOC109815905 isoform X2 [Cajanus cajan]
MDFHGMKRKRLQALCKKHGIPANLKNTEMADRLFLIFKGKDIEDPVGSENGGTEKDVEMIDLVSPSPVVEERSDFSAKISRISEDAMLGFETNLSLEITREDFGICGVEEGMKSELNKEQVAPDLVALEEFNNHLVEGEVEKLGDQTNLVEDVCGTGKTGNETEEQEDNAYNPEGSETEKLEDNANNPEVSNKKDLNLLLVSPEEFGNHMVEGEVEKLSDQTNLVEDVCGTGKAGAETEKQDDNDNSPEGCRRNYLNLSLVSCEEFGYPLIEGEAKKYDDFICVGDAVHNVGNERSEVDSMHLDLDAMDIDGKTNVTVEHFTNDVHASCEVNSSDLNIHEMVASGTATKNADRCEARFVSSPKMSITPALESIGFSPKLLSNSETEVSQYESNYSPETLKVDIEICDTKENIQIDVNKEQVGDNPEDVYEAPYVMKMNDEDLVQAPSEEFGNHLLEGEVEKLGEKNNIEDVCENGKGRDDAVERGDHNSPQGSNIKDVNVLHVSQQEFGYPLVEEIQKSDGNIYNDTTGTDEKTNLTSEHFADVVPNFPSSFKYSDGTPDQFLRTYPENEIKFIDLNIHQDICEEELKSPEKPGSIADPGECFGFSPKNLEVSVIEGFQAETYFNSSTLGDIGTCNMKASIQSDKMEKVEYSKEDANLLHRSMEECNVHIEQGEVTGLFNNSDVHDVGENGQDDDANSPQGSTHHKEFGNPLVEGVHKLDDYTCVYDAVYDVSNGRSKVDTRCLDSSNGPINNDGKTNESVEHFIDEFHSSTFKNSDGTPVDFLQNDASREVKSDLKIHEMVASDTSEANIVSSRKISLSLTSDRVVVISPKQLNKSGTQGLLSETIYSPETKRVDIGICDVEENMQIDVNKEQVDDNQQVIHATSGVMVLNSEDLVQVASVEAGDHLLEGEVEKSGLMSDSEECIRFLPNNLELSANKGFQAETYFDPNTLGDAVATCNVEESLQGDQIEKEYSEEVLHMANELVLLQRSMEENNPVEGEITRLFDYSDDHEENGVTGAEDDKNQHYVKGDMASFENYLLNGFQSIDDAGGQNSDEKPGDYVPTIMPQPGEMKSCTINLQQNSASGTVSGDEGIIQEKLEISPKYSPIASSEEYVLGTVSGDEGTIQENLATPPRSKPTECVPTMPQPSEMKSCTINLQQNSASGTNYEEECTIQEKLETPPKSTPIASSEDNNIFYPKLLELSMKKEMKIVKSLPVKHARDVLGNSDMKENIKIAKKEQVGSIISKSAFPKRQPLQDLQQN